jgi:transcriptional regulator with XRE-family HTH domain
MPKQTTIPAELATLGKWLATARKRRRLTQRELALQSGLSQPRVSGIEKGTVLPTLPQLMDLARTLGVPLQWFLNGSVVPGTDVPELALQLRWLGVVDLLVPGAVVPGAFRPTEQAFVFAVRGTQPNPRIIEAMPAALAWNRWSPARLRAYSRPRESRACIRLAWLADVALTIHRAGGFPGGCPGCKSLELFLAPLSRAKLRLTNDDLGRPGDDSAIPPVSKRWKIRYDATLSVFIERAKHLSSLSDRPRLPPTPEARCRDA